MAFVNEFIPEADLKAFGIEAIDLKYVVGGSSARHWTIDRERNVYLRHAANGPHDPALFSNGIWTFYWQGDLLEVGLDSLSLTRGADHTRTAHMRLRYLHLPPHLEPQRQAVLAALEEALLAYKDGGMYGSGAPFVLRFET